MKEMLLQKYAELLVKTGVNIQKGQILVVLSPIECAPFTRMIAETAYKAGAKEVVVKWGDESLTKLRFLHASDEVFEEFPQWQQEFYLSYVRQGAAFMSVLATDPELLKDVDSEKIAKDQKVKNSALAEYRESLMGNKNVWCVASIPTAAWAKKVFQGVSEQEAMDKLWEAIFQTVRVNAADPVAAWEEHKSNLKKYIDFFNATQFQYLHYKNSLGTDLRIELPVDHVWYGGSDHTPNGTEFVANMPTEEVYTAPKKTGVNGTVISSMPLNYNGSLIEDFSLRFQDGKIVEFHAKKGEDMLRSLIESDEGAYYLGEVALVPYDSPISNLGILFYNTLFDENASCHLAIGKAYPVCIKGGEDMEKEELEKRELNDSLVHEDFMIGTKDLQIVGITKEGKEVPIFENGNFVF